MTGPDTARNTSTHTSLAHGECDVLFCACLRTVDYGEISLHPSAQYEGVDDALGLTHTSAVPLGGFLIIGITLHISD